MYRKYGIPQGAMEGGADMPMDGGRIAQRAMEGDAAGYLIPCSVYH